MALSIIKRTMLLRRLRRKEGLFCDVSGAGRGIDPKAIYPHEFQRSVKDRCYFYRRMRPEAICVRDKVA